MSNPAAKLAGRSTRFCLDGAPLPVRPGEHDRVAPHQRARAPTRGSRPTRIRPARSFRASIAAFRRDLGSSLDERRLYDFVCSAGALGYRVPDRNVRTEDVTGPSDPRRSLLASIGPANGPDPAFSTGARDRLVGRLASAIAARASSDLFALSVLIQYAPIALAPDGRIPREPRLRVAWETLIRVFAALHSTGVRRIRRLPALPPERFEEIARAASRGLRVGRRASGRRPGRAGRELAVDRSLCAFVGRVVGRRVEPGYVAKLLYYTRAGDFLWPHGDDPTYTVNLLICVTRRLPKGATRGSALLTYGPGGRMRRHELLPGQAVAMEPGVIHSREPVARGERLVLLSILFR
jgi:hypothetical protein